MKVAAVSATVGRLEMPVGEPDAANPHVRFDERGVETGHGEASEAPADERAGTDMPSLNNRATPRNGQNCTLRADEGGWP